MYIITSNKDERSERGNEYEGRYQDSMIKKWPNKGYNKNIKELEQVDAPMDEVK